jgi:pimeloyl-ACP methyl ester carboxylesterase
MRPGTTTLLVAAWIAAAGAAPPARGQDDDVAPGLREGRGEREIVLIHGLGASAAVWDEVKPYLMGSMAVWTYELHGHGETQPMADPSVAREAEALAAFLRERDIVYPTLVGHGLGGMVAMRYTFDHPAVVYRLVVIDAAPRQLATEEEKRFVALSLLQDYDRFVAARYASYSPRDDISRRIVDMALKTHEATFIALLMSSFDFDLTDEMARQAVPILVLGSEMLFPAGSDTRTVLDQLGYGQARTVAFKRVAGAGHYVMLERPVHTASVLLAFAVTESLR